MEAVAELICAIWHVSVEAAWERFGWTGGLLALIAPPALPFLALWLWLR